MNDRSLRVLEQYELEIISTRRGRGSWIFETSQGLRILSDYSGSENRALFQNCVMDRVREGGYANVDRILPNKEGLLVSKDWEEHRYVVKEWYTGHECDTSNEVEILAAVQNLARLHRLMRLREDSFFPEDSIAGSSDDRKEKGDKAETAAESGVVTANGEDASGTIAETISDGVRANEVSFGGISDRKTGVGVTDVSEADIGSMFTREVVSHSVPSVDTFRRNYTAQPPLMELHAWNAQLRKIRSFVRARPRKNVFERSFLDCFERYFTQALEAERQLTDISERLETLRTAQSGMVCHGDYSHHHILMRGYEVATTNFDNCRFDFQINDLYRFMRKILEKHDWNTRLGMRMVETYDRTRTLSGVERRLLFVRMLYPEKFRKLAASYYSSNKAWISRQYMEKLEKINRQETARQAFMKRL
ncbi:MAG: hypothetical protein LUD16_03510 [Lachnospiraceae bacterium]|nr:hypothetical protein [Lachnospiraceae bacterium]